MARAQVLRRVHRARELHYGRDTHGRVELPLLSRVQNSELNFFQFQLVWYEGRSKRQDKLDRVIGWAHPALVSLLRYENISLFIDGTFRCLPRLFKQCVVVMVYDRGTKLFVSVFYVLCTAKTHDVYWNTLQCIRNACGDTITRKEVICDFKSALINAVRDWFPDTKILGCLFHFKQACKRKIIKYRLPESETKIVMERGVLDILTVVDRERIPKPGVAWVKAKVRQLCEMRGVVYSTKSSYFDRTWIKLLPPTFWNVHGIRRDLVARTNNALERFNREINAAFSSLHPSLPRFVQTIEKLARRYVDLRDDINRGATTRQTIELPSTVALPETEPIVSETSDIELEEEGGVTL